MRQQYESKLDKDHYIYCDNDGTYSVIDNPNHGISQRFFSKHEAREAFRNNQLNMFYIFEELRPNQHATFNDIT